MMVSEDYWLAPKLSVLADRLAGAAEIPLGVKNHFISHECINAVLAF